MTPARPSRAVPDHVRWAVDQLPLRPSSRVLEFGSGSGASLDVLLPAIPHGSLLAIDRSAAAADRIAARIAGRPDAAVATVERLALAGLEAHRSFDVAFGVNVNVFWTGDAVRELAVLRAVLAPGGTLLLAWGAPAAGMAARDVIGPVADRVASAGFGSIERLRGPHGSAVRALG